jgi:hypothetical protein
MLPKSRNVAMPSRESQGSEVIFAEPGNRAWLSRQTSAGRFRRLARGIYTRSHDDPADVVRRNLWAIVAHLVPGAVVTDRCGRTHQPSDGVLTVVHARERRVELPGLVIEPRSGPGPMPGDIALPFGLWGASDARAILDNLGGAGERFLGDEAIEAWIVDIAGRSNGPARLNAIRDRARALAPALRRSGAVVRLNAVVSAALTTAPAPPGASDALAAFAAGTPYDRVRVERFEGLAAALADLAPEPLPALPSGAARRALLPFYEAYFSNYIEGTEFTLDEAAAIVFDERVPAARPKDAHDILGTFRLVGDEALMRVTPRTPDELVELLRERHGRMLEARPEALPGRWKAQANRAGSTQFVDPSLVEATLRAGFTAGEGLLDPFARALFIMFLVAEVHPFTDGNGRMARVMMNAELATAGQVRIIVPTIYRLNYLAALKGATHNGVYEALIATMRFAWRWTARIDFSSRTAAERDLEQTNALRDPTEAESYGVRLVLPGARDAR